MRKRLNLILDANALAELLRRLNTTHLLSNIPTDPIINTSTFNSPAPPQRSSTWSYNLPPQSDSYIPHYPSNDVRINTTPSLRTPLKIPESSTTVDVSPSFPNNVSRVRSTPPAPTLVTGPDPPPYTSSQTHGYRNSYGHFGAPAPQPVQSFEPPVTTLETRSELYIPRNHPPFSPPPVRPQPSASAEFVPTPFQRSTNLPIPSSQAPVVRHRLHSTNPWVPDTRAFPDIGPPATINLTRHPHTRTRRLASNRASILPQQPETLTYLEGTERITCAICDEAKLRKQFPGFITENCTHEVTTCLECLSTWIGSCIDSKGWKGITCPELKCGKTLIHDEIQQFADTATFEK